MFSDIFENGRRSMAAEVLSMLTSGEYGGRTEAWEEAVKYLKEVLDETG